MDSAPAFVRFLLSGGLNTVLTYLLYLALLPQLGVAPAYSLAYAAGVLLAYLLNRYFVFRAGRGGLSLALFPLVYLAQYLASMAIVWGWVALLGQDARTGPLVAIAVMVPLTFVLSRYVFVARS